MFEEENVIHACTRDDLIDDGSLIEIIDILKDEPLYLLPKTLGVDSVAISRPLLHGIAEAFEDSRMKALVLLNLWRNFAFNARVLQPPTAEDAWLLELQESGREDSHKLMAAWTLESFKGKNMRCVTFMYPEER